MRTVSIPSGLISNVNVIEIDDDGNVFDAASVYGGRIGEFRNGYLYLDDGPFHSEKVIALDGGDIYDARDEGVYSHGTYLGSIDSDGDIHGPYGGYAGHVSGWDDDSSSYSGSYPSYSYSGGGGGCSRTSSSSSGSSGTFFFIVIAIAIALFLFGDELWYGDETSPHATVGGIEYRFNDYHTCTVVGGPNSGKVTIPAAVSYNGASYRVSGIASEAFKNSSITEVVIASEGVTVERSAFEGCRSLRRVEFRQGHIIISSSAFYGSNLGTVVFGPGVTGVSTSGKINEHNAPAPFKNCSSLTLQPEYQFSHSDMSNLMSSGLFKTVRLPQNAAFAREDIQSLASSNGYSTSIVMG